METAVSAALARVRSKADALDYIRRVADINKNCLSEFVPSYGSQMGCVLAIHVVKAAADVYKETGQSDGQQALCLLLSEQHPLLPSPPLLFLLPFTLTPPIFPSPLPYSRISTE